MSATKKQPPITDIRAVLQRVIDEKSRADGKPFSVNAWDALIQSRRGEDPEKGSTVKNVMQGKSQSPRLDTLDEAAQAVGYGDFIEMATGAPRFDLELLRVAVLEVLDIFENGPFEVSAEDAADLVVAICQHYASHRRGTGKAELRDRLEFTLTHSRTKQAAG